ncbi:serine hydrolase domain-containing protein [Yinghuangia seranimata]|uniref:serine hydrolase domain-containing protein n=1 Tax=Yinghuangia seranimata TaxID=408067 RepID=UPI00248CE761|nr:serine hydrolase [Yinghuangia seranimata]MDI2124982.1 serine hydrolase [Yinghuangia seranimata]
MPAAWAAAVGVAAGAAWLWRHQAEVATSRPFNEWTFTHTAALLPTETVPRAVRPRLLPHEPRGLEEFTYDYAGARRTLADLHKRTFTTGFAVVHRGALVHECYPGRFASPQARFQLFSVTKSVTSMLVGIALEEGAIASVDETAVSYRPELAGTAYDGPTIEHLLHMSSGAGFVEDYTDPDGAIARFERAVMGGGSILDVLRAVPTVAKPGTVFNYSTMDSQVLGWVLESATGMSLARYAAERLWGPIGAERDAYYFLTRGRPRTALGGGSFNAAIRDIARLGLLMARGGAVDGRQIVPEAWVERGRGAGLAHLEAGALGPEVPEWYGYANQWWTLGGEHRAFTGLGIHGQFLWVDPEADVVVVKTSAWSTAEDLEREAETVAALTALVSHLDAGR